MKLLININRLGQSLQEGDIDTIHSIIKNENAKDGTDINNIIADQLIQWFKIPPANISKKMLERYSKMSPRDLFIPFTLAKPEIIEQRIVAPLESAKRFACLEEYLASIALSGLVGEMLAIFIWDISSEQRKNGEGDIIRDKQLFKNNFDRLSQALRINLVETFGYIDIIMAKKFRDLASNRNRVLHSWTDSYSREIIEKTAIDCYFLAASLMKEILKLELNDAGSLKMDQKIINYIRSKESKIDSELTNEPEKAA